MLSLIKKKKKIEITLHNEGWPQVAEAYLQLVLICVADMSLFHLCFNHLHIPFSPFFFFFFQSLLLTAYTCNQHFPVTYVHQSGMHQARLQCTLVKTRA